jgi:hypothetical protein
MLGQTTIFDREFSCSEGCQGCGIQLGDAAQYPCLSDNCTSD